MYKKFHYEANLAKHVLLDKHKYKAERETAVDFAQRNYALALWRSNLQTIQKAQQALVSSESADGPTLDMGWALKTYHPMTQFEDKQKDYLIGKFEEGENLRNLLFLFSKSNYTSFSCKFHF